MSAELKFSILAILLLSYSITIESSDFSIESSGQCGGALEGDSGLIIYPDPSTEVQEDELCIWTVHLLTTTTVRLNISQLDFNGGDNVCSEGALRTYSLTNLVQGENMESYTICPENQGSDRVIFLSDNTMVVTFRTGNLTTQGGKGFTLSWEGIKHASPAIAHASSISTIPDGIIRHPIIGEYPPNTLSTWLVSLNRHQSGIVSGLDLNIESLNIETCDPETPGLSCFCDAAIIYQVHSDGSLHEVQRLCGELAQPYTINLSELNFIVAFYSDAVNIDGQGTGFQLIWTNPKPPTTTTTPATTTVPGPTTPEPDVIVTTCNGILDIADGEIGRISYTSTQSYEGNDETCTWTIRANGSPNITLNLESFSTDSLDGGSVLNVHYLDLNTYYIGSILIQEQLEELNQEITIPGPVAFVTFQSNKNRTLDSTTGFQLKITRDFEPVLEFPMTSSYSDIIYEEDNGVIRYPDTPGYLDNELSTFIINPTQSNGSAYVKLHFDNIQVEDCYDVINVFQLEVDGFVFQKRMCWEDYVSNFYSSNVFLLIFVSDEATIDDGFEASWTTKFQTPSTTCGGIIDLSRDLGAIEYTETESDTSNEQCIWTIRGSSSQTITFELEEYEFAACNGNSLYATGFEGNFTNDQVIRTNRKYVGNCELNGNELITMTGPVTFLVFARAPGTFKLRIEHEPNASEILYPFASNYTDFTRNEENGTITYPAYEGMQQFKPYEWDTFVINPLGRNDSSRLSLKFTYLGLGQAGSCWSANVMTYEVRDGLVFQYMLCGGQTQTEIFGDKTIIVLLRTTSVWTSYSNQISFGWKPREE